MRRALAVAAIVLLALLPLAAGASAKPAVSSLYLSVSGDSSRFKSQTGQASAIQHAFIGWDQCRTYATRLPVLLGRLGGVPMLHIGTGGPLGKSEAITPLEIANGQGGGNAFYRFYPGDRYLEIVGNDLYGAYGQCAGPQNEVLYAFAREHDKPFALPEWGVKGADYPAFVRYVCTFIRSHTGIELAACYKSQAGGMFDLANKPASRQVYRRCITPLGRKAP